MCLDAYRRLDRGGAREVTNQWFPVLCTGLLGWFVGQAMLSVYSIAIDTILLSYCQDHHLGRKSHTHTVRAPKELDRFVKGESAPEESAAAEVEVALITGTGPRSTQL